MENNFKEIILEPCENMLNTLKYVAVPVDFITLLVWNLNPRFPKQQILIYAQASFCTGRIKAGD